MWTRLKFRVGSEWIVSRRVAAVRRERCRVGRVGRSCVRDGGVIDGIAGRMYGGFDVDGREMDAMSG